MSLSLELSRLLLSFIYLLLFFLFFSFTSAHQVIRRRFAEVYPRTESDGWMDACLVPGALWSLVFDPYKC